MPFSHHSHSGEFCGHAQDKLEDILQVAIGKKMDLYAMTEHMPRGEQDLYPEEVKAGITPVALDDLFKAYYTEACRLRDTYSDKIALLVGMEIDWLRPSSKVEIQDLLSTYPLDLFIGSVHHVHGIPTDYSRDLYLEARAKSGGTEERILEDYFDLQLEMLKSMKPPIVGHFDVIRLWSDDPNGSFTEWPTVWHKIQRNLDIIKEYGGVLELNSAALRKGMREPYPNGEICKGENQEALTKGCAFTLSDDCHSCSQVATCYNSLVDFAETIGISTITYFKRGLLESSLGDSRFPCSSKTTVSLTGLKTRPFFH